jgi:peptidoglycan/LPS O-acetylase OafA/YrhL
MEKYFYNKPMFTESTWAVLAITRFFLAFVVLYGHLFAYVLGFESVPFQFILNLGGKAAVMVFLLISGISIGHSYIRNREEFLKRRFLRIYPLYFVAVLFAVLLQRYLGSPYEIPNTTMIAAGNLTSIANFFFLQGIATITITYNGPLWSIGVEVFLYLMVPILMYLRTLYVLIIALISMFSFTFLEHYFLYGHENLRWAWPFLIGFIISAKNKPLFAIPLLVLTVFIVLYNKTFSDSLSIVLISFGILVCLISMYMKLYLSKKIIIFFNFLGTISYPLYIFHIPIFILLYYLGVREYYNFIGLVILLCIAINYIFDVWLKKIFWKPLVDYIEIYIKEFRIKRISNKTLKT